MARRTAISNQRQAERAKPHPDGKPIIRYRVAPTLFLTVCGLLLAAFTRALKG